MRQPFWCLPAPLPLRAWVAEQCHRLGVKRGWLARQVGCDPRLLEQDLASAPEAFLTALCAALDVDPAALSQECSVTSTDDPWPAE